MDLVILLSRPGQPAISYALAWHISGVSLDYIYERRQGVYARPSQGMGHGYDMIAYGDSNFHDHQDQSLNHAPSDPLRSNFGFYAWLI